VFLGSFRGVCCGCHFLLVSVRFSFSGSARRQSRATHVACTKCVQVSLGETCKFLHRSCMKTCNAFALHVFMQLGCMQYEIHKFLRKHVQRKSVARKRAMLLRCLHVHELARNLHGACTELARKLVKFCTNLHALVFLALKFKRSIPTPILTSC